MYTLLNIVYIYIIESLPVYCGVCIYLLLHLVGLFVLLHLGIDSTVLTERRLRYIIKIAIRVTSRTPAGNWFEFEDFGVNSVAVS